MFDSWRRLSARACLLVLHRVELNGPLYPDLDTVIVYPSAYRVREQRREGYVTIEGEQTRLGESWTRIVVLSWDAVTPAAPPVRVGASGNSVGSQRARGR